MRPQRVAHLISSSGFYGAEQVLVTLAKSSSRLGMRCTILCLEDVRQGNRELFQRASIAGIDAKHLPCRRRIDWSALDRLTELLSDLKVDLLHSHGAKADFYGLLAARRLKLPVVATLHLWSHTPFIVRLYDWVDAIVLRFFDKVVGVSEAIADEMEQKRIPRRLIRVIRNGVDLESLAFPGNGAGRQIRQELGIKGQSPVVGIVGRLTPEKGHRFFLAAAREILQSIPEAVFVIVGGGRLEEELRDHAAALGITGAVRFAGFRRDVLCFYEAFDLLVSSSLREGTPMVLLEAMAGAKPVVATRVGGVPELVRHDETGLLVPPRDVRSLARAILDLLKDQARRERLAWAGRRLVWEEFSAERMAQAYQKVYQEACSGSRSMREQAKAGRRIAWR
jgi:glycosyltransferase involved in cell wall biosynthesis